jgi:hypothetical protein
MKLEKAKEIAASEEWEGDLRINMATVVGACKVLARRVWRLERIIVKCRREFRSGGDSVDARAWLFRIEIDEDQYE